MAMVRPGVQNGRGRCTEDRFEADAFGSDEFPGASIYQGTATRAMAMAMDGDGDGYGDVQSTLINSHYVSRFTLAARALPAFVDCAMSHKAFRLKSPQNMRPVFTTSICCLTENR